jgi:hypothetical protein
MNCIICFESSPSLISCCGCQKSFCRPCCEQYLLSVKGNPCCADPSCGVAWSRDFLYKINTREFMRQWIKKRQDDLFKREMPLMAPTTVLVQNHREAAAKREEAAKLRDDARELMRKIIELREKASRLNFQAETLESIKLTDVAPASYRRHCFASGCRGFLDESCKCAVCDKLFCEDCQMEKLKDHMCEAGQVESVRYIQATSRPCPTCSTMISKTDGCDQMYCIVCDTAFSWMSGEVDAGFIHNPHYLRRMEAMGYIPRAPVGDELPPWRDLADMVPREEELIRGFYAVVYDLLGKQMSLFTPVNNDYERAQMLIGKMTEEKFRSVIQLKEKRWLLHREIAKSTDTLLRVGCRLFWELASGHISLTALRESIEKMRVAANQELLELSRRWEHLCVPFYNEEFEVGRQKWRSDM